MVAERAGYTVTMFLIDTSPSMGNIRTVEVETPNGGTQEIEMTNLQRCLQFVKLKIQEMIFNGRKTDQCGVIVFGTKETKNIVNAANDGYENIVEYMPIGKFNAASLAKLDALEPSTVAGDPIDALVVGVETQAKYLGKKSWTRKIYILTDGESPIELEDWEAIVGKMDQLDVSLTVVGVDFDDEYLPYTESNKNNIKRVNEQFYETLTSSMKSGVVGNLEYALQETAIPEVKSVRSVLMNTVLRIGDAVNRPDEAIELAIKTSKCTSLARPKGFKKFGLRVKKPKEGDEDMDEDEDSEKDLAYAQLKLRTEYYFDRIAAEAEANGDEEDVKMKVEDDEENLLEETLNNAEEKKKDALERVEREDLVRGYKYGTTYVPCPDGDGEFKRLPTRKGIDICGFFKAKNFRRELCMGEVQYIWADPSSAQQQVALSSIVKAMTMKVDPKTGDVEELPKDEHRIAIARWVTRDDMAPKMGVLIPIQFDQVDCLLWNQMPFADDVRRYTFASLDHLINKKGEVLTEHPYLPTQEQLNAMDEFVDAMDLSDAGDEDEDGKRTSWFAPEESYNPAIHRIKQAMFHCAVVNDIPTNPVPPPHPDLTKYFEPPKRALKRARKATEQCKSVFNVREVPKKVVRAKKDEHVHAQDDDDDTLLLDRKRPAGSDQSPMDVDVVKTTVSSTGKEKVITTTAEESETEDEEEEELLLDKKKPSTPQVGKKQGPLPTPARSVSPSDSGNVPGRIVGSTYPLKDFQDNIAQGDVVTKAVEDLSTVITEVILRPFAFRRAKEMVECMVALRKTCLEEDEIEAWNNFIVDLKEKCLSKRGNPNFWANVQELGRDLSLIYKQEAEKQGGDSPFTENEADEFIS